MSFTRKTLKILALIYFVLGIASLVTAASVLPRAVSIPRTVRTPHSQRSCLSPRVSSTLPQRRRYQGRQQAFAGGRRV